MTEEQFTVPSACEIVSKRIFLYPQESVFRAWSEPELLGAWWGPAGFTNTFYEFDFRPGGRWRFTMHGPEKGNYENECTFHTIEPPRLIVWDRVSQPLFRVVATFEALSDDSCLLTFHMQFDTEAACDKIRKFAEPKNEENFDKLEIVLGKAYR